MSSAVEWRETVVIHWPPMTQPKSQGHEESGVWNFRDVPRDTIVKAKIGAALQNTSVKVFLMDLVEAHWQELEKKGMLPKGR